MAATAVCSDMAIMLMLVHCLLVPYTSMTATAVCSDMAIMLMLVHCLLVPYTSMTATAVCSDMAIMLMLVYCLLLLLFCVFCFWSWLGNSFFCSFLLSTYL